MKQRRSQGFTLLELLLVMLLLGIVMSMAGVMFGRDPQRMANQKPAFFPVGTARAAPGGAGRIGTGYPH